MKDQDDIDNHNVNINCKKMMMSYIVIKHKIQLKMKSLLTTIMKKMNL